MKSILFLALILSVIAACDTDPPLINVLVDDTPGPATEEWLETDFLLENPNAAEYRLIEVNSRQFLNDVERARLTLLNGDIVTAIRRSSEVYDGSILWAGVIEGASDSDIEVRATSNPYLNGHVVIGERVELFAHAVPGADSIMYRVNMPDRSLSPQADILPDADPVDIQGVAWRALLHALPASAYRIARFDEETWRRKTKELEKSGTAVMHFFDDTPYRIVSTAIVQQGKPTKYYPTEYHWRIDGAEYSTVGLRAYLGGELRGYVQSPETGNVRVTKLDDSEYYIVWVMHPEFSKRID